MRKSKPETEHENPERWLVSYADFITLMFAFFVILFATSEQNVEKAKQFENSIRQNLIKFGAMGESGAKVNQGAEYNSPIDSSLKPFSQGSQETQKVQKKVESFLQSSLSTEQLNKLVRDIAPDSNGVRITLSADTLFERGSVNMRREALPILDQIASILKTTDRRVIIEGNSDDTPKAKDVMPTSWELSSMQAAKVLRYFTKIHKIDANKLAAMTFGDQRPLPPYNRRIDLLIVTEDLPY